MHHAVLVTWSVAWASQWRLCARAYQHSAGKHLVRRIKVCPCSDEDPQRLSAPFARSKMQRSLAELQRQVV